MSSFGIGLNLLTFTLLFSSACTNRRRGGTQLSVSSKVGGLEKGHPLSSEGVCHGVAPSFSWSSSRSPAGVLGVVCPEGGLVYKHTCDVSEPLDLLLFDVLFGLKGVHKCDPPPRNES